MNNYQDAMKYARRVKTRLSETDRELTAELGIHSSDGMLNRKLSLRLFEDAYGCESLLEYYPSLSGIAERLHSARDADDQFLHDLLHNDRSDNGIDAYVALAVSNPSLVPDSSTLHSLSARSAELARNSYLLNVPTGIVWATINGSKAVALLVEGKKHDALTYFGKAVSALRNAGIDKGAEGKTMREMMMYVSRKVEA